MKPVTILLPALVCTSLWAQETGALADAWKPVSGSWALEDGTMTSAGEGARIVSRRSWMHFELSCSVRLAESGVAGIGYRGEYLMRLRGDGSVFGRLRAQKRRGIIARVGQRIETAPGTPAPVVAGALDVEPIEGAGWHKVRILVQGEHVEHHVDDQLLLTLDDGWKKASRQGPIEFQATGRFEVKDLVIRELTPPPPPLKPKRLVATRIWSADAENDDEITLRRRFEVKVPVRRALLTVSCDNRCVIWINGKRAGEARDWERPTSIDVAKFLRLGENVVAIHAFDEGGPQAMVFWLSWDDAAGGGGGAVTSDLDWRVRVGAPEDDSWRARKFDDGDWLKASRVHGDVPFGQNVWGYPPKR